MELLVTITIIVVLAGLSFTGYGFVMKKAQMSKSVGNMRQLAAGTLVYAQDHAGKIPRGDEGADGSGAGGRGIIWINHIAPNIGYPELETQPLNKSVDGMDQWTYLVTKYKNASFVCGALTGNELTITKRTTIDAIGGIGYNINPQKTSLINGLTNGSFNGNISPPITLSSVTYQEVRCMYASSYDWHLGNNSTYAHNRFGKNKAAMVFWDGACRLVTKTEYIRAVGSPDKR